MDRRLEHTIVHWEGRKVRGRVDADSGGSKETHPTDKISAQKEGPGGKNEWMKKKSAAGTLWESAKYGLVRRASMSKMNGGRGGRGACSRKRRSKPPPPLLPDHQKTIRACAARWARHHRQQLARAARAAHPSAVRPSSAAGSQGTEVLQRLVGSRASSGPPIARKQHSRRANYPTPGLAHGVCSKIEPPRRLGCCSFNSAPRPRLLPSFSTHTRARPFLIHYLK